jgi:hypothetical protein
VDKTQFQPHMQYTVTLRTPEGASRPASIYVFRTYDPFMVVRQSADGKLHKLAYEDVLLLVDGRKVPPERRYHVPAVMLEEKFWKGRTALEHYASSPGSGK